MLNNNNEVLDQALNDLWEEELSFLKTLGSYNTTLGNEREIQLFIGQYLKDNGLETQSFDINTDDISKYQNYGLSYMPYEDRPVVVGISKGTAPDKGRSLILQAHVDVVEAGPLDHWDTEPFSPVIKDDKMYGRGILDMKGGLAANIFALKALIKSGVKLNGDVQIQAVIEEELTGNGALALLDKGYTADAALIPEPTQLRILTSQVGVIYMKVTITGQGAHVEKAEQAQNAIMKAYKVISELDEYRAFINNKKKHPAFEDHPHPLNVNIGTINGGDWTGSVPVVCSFTVRIGFYPGTDPKDVQEEVKNWIDESCLDDAWLKDHPPAIEFFGFNAHGFQMDTDSEFYKLLSESHQIATGKEVTDLPFTATTDARVFDEFGIPVTCYGPAGDNMHAPNEYIDLESLKNTTRTIAYFIERWCNQEE